MERTYNHDFSLVPHGDPQSWRCMVGGKNPTFSAAFFVCHSASTHIPEDLLALLPSSSPESFTRTTPVISTLLNSINSQHRKLTIFAMLPPSYSDHDPTPPPSFDSLALLFSHYPIITQFAKLVTTGDLIRLSRTSSTIREALLQSPSYWAQLVSLTTLACSEKGHIKGDNIKACVICSMPVCETCIVKIDFFGTSNTFSNRIRTFCDSCWCATDFSISPTDHAPRVCICVAKDGWLCSTCRIVERKELDDNKYVCATDGCENPHYSSEKQRVCTWCHMPLPPAWRPQTTEMVISCGRPENVNDDEAPGYEPRIEEEPNSPVMGKLKKAKSTDKVRVAGWDKMDEEERKAYQEAWLKKGAREREREKVHRASGGGESSSAGASEAVDREDEAPEFEDEEEETEYTRLGEPSGSGAAEPSGGSQQKLANGGSSS